MFYDRGQHHEFVSVVKELEPPQGELTKDMVYPFEFATVEKQCVCLARLCSKISSVVVVVVLILCKHFLDTNRTMASMFGFVTSCASL